MSIGRELLNVPMGDMIRQMAFAIAEAQVKLDESSIKVAEMMGGLRTIYDDDGNQIIFIKHSSLNINSNLSTATLSATSSPKAFV